MDVTRRQFMGITAGTAALSVAALNGFFDIVLLDDKQLFDEILSNANPEAINAVFDMSRTRRQKFLGVNLKRMLANRVKYTEQRRRHLQLFIADDRMHSADLHAFCRGLAKAGSEQQTWILNCKKLRERVLECLLPSTHPHANEVELIRHGKLTNAITRAYEEPEPCQVRRS